jgi:uncharacterized protein (TIGR00369 family)
MARADKSALVTTALIGIEVLQQAAAGTSPMPPAAALLGWQLLHLEPGRIRVQYTAREEFYNPHGNVQGGFLAAMLDDAMGPALFSTLDADQFAPTIEMKINFLRPAVAGTLMAEGCVVHRTRSLAFLEGKLLTEDGALLATATATARILQATPAAGDDHGL